MTSHYIIIDGLHRFYTYIYAFTSVYANVTLLTKEKEATDLSRGQGNGWKEERERKGYILIFKMKATGMI